MANVQPQFAEFSRAIRLGRFDEETILREKRDIIRKRIEDRLPEVLEAHAEEAAEFSFKDQGSYAFGTGVKPLDGDYDIDQGIYFMLTKSDYNDPVVLKSRVFEALDGHTKEVRVRQPCVTVFYEQAGEPIYHVDLAVYVSDSLAGSPPYVLGQGRIHSDQANRFWEDSDQDSLSATILDRFAETDRNQFRHVVRYLKRWKDNNFSAGGHAAPRGIGLTVAIWEEFQAVYQDRLAGKHDDLAALRYAVDAMLRRFAPVWDEQELAYSHRLVAKLPVRPYNDLFGRMTNMQMDGFEQKLKSLRDALEGAHDAVDPVEACKKLRKTFGDDFPVPEPSKTAQKTSPAIISSSNSA